MGSFEALKKDVAGRPLLWLIALLVMVATASLLATPHPVAALLPGLGLVALLVLGRFPQAGFLILVFMIPRR